MESVMQAIVYKELALPVFLKVLVDQEQQTVCVEAYKKDDKLGDIEGYMIDKKLTGLWSLFGRQILNLKAERDKQNRQSLGSGEASDFAAWMFPINNTKLFAVRNRFLDTAQSKALTYRYLDTEGFGIALQVAQPFADDALDNCTLLLNANPIFGYYSNITFKEMSLAQVIARDGFSVFPKVLISGENAIESGGLLTATIAIADERTEEIIKRDCTLYLESTAGYLPQTRVKLVNGVGKFKIRALDLEPGDTIKIKAGWKNYSGAAEHVLTVYGNT